jgi:hypothetical protein
MSTDELNPTTANKIIEFISRLMPWIRAERRLNKSIQAALGGHNESIQAALGDHNDNLIRLRKYLQVLIERETKNCAKQVMASAACEAYFTSGVLPSFNSESHTWPISSDFAFYLIELLETESYDLIVEFGSGHSTVLVSRVLAQMASRQGAKPAAQFLSFDHLPEYYNRTQALLQLAKTRELVDLRLAPLTPYTAPNGKSYPYYSCQVAIQELAQHQPLQGLKVLAIIDGPPSGVGEHARYPAGPILMDAFKGASLDLLLDDYIRDDEKQIAKLWQADCEAIGFSCSMREIKLEKQACLVSARTLEHEE